MNAELKEEVQEERDFEAEARAQGWTGPENWRGDPDKFKTAEQFVKDGENIPAILKSKVDRLEQRVEQLLASNQKVNEMTQRTLEKEKKEKQKLVKQLEEVRKQAVTDGDGEAFDRADKQLEDLKTDHIETQGIDPLAKNWLEHNTWYETNDKLAAFADGIADRLVAQGYTGQAYFDELTKRTMDTFPEDFGNKNRKKPSSVDGGTPPVENSSKRTFESLPKEAKDAFAQFKRDIPGFTKEQYLESYEWE